MSKRFVRPMSYERKVKGGMSRMSGGLTAGRPDFSVRPSDEWLSSRFNTLLYLTQREDMFSIPTDPAINDIEMKTLLKQIYAYARVGARARHLQVFGGDIPLYFGEMNDVIASYFDEVVEPMGSIDDMNDPIEQVIQLEGEAEEEDEEEAEVDDEENDIEELLTAEEREDARNGLNHFCGPNSHLLRRPNQLCETVFGLMRKLDSVYGQWMPESESYRQTVGQLIVFIKGTDLWKQLTANSPDRQSLTSTTQEIN